ncbi:unannotated protein [freshwater metagenome]|jgi:hypothetical protein|uniref:Unannotated protein n=1 Tax=freshwater metagenome TaxID=449393 RepID=A0A6J7NHA5_9ZZZZ|nr:hypothetical protein [Actinomycetota bacterium]MSY68217.1 hypothetical protein [Actinomycetota bacterium]MSZ47090.1 hypothetical protein [Actinomycetota bacterium]
MSKRESSDEFDDELVNAEFESMVEGLSLDQSSPRTYLDELDAFEDQNRFTPPAIEKKGVKDQLRDALRAITRWKNNRGNEHPEDGAAL